MPGPMPTTSMIWRSMPALEMATGDGWTVWGPVIPFGRRTKVEDVARAGTGDQFVLSYMERIAHHGFDRDIANRGGWVNLMVGHDGDHALRYLGRCIRLEAHKDALYATFRLNRDHPLAEQARCGELTGWSAGAQIYESRRVVDPDGVEVIERTSLNLRHVAATASPQYEGAGVQIVREHVMIDNLPTAPIRDALRARYGMLTK